MDQHEKLQKLIKLGQYFSPASPIIVNDLFFGRQAELNKIVDAIYERGQHIVLYGERGVGKTSLANIVNASIQNIISVKVTCTRSDSFNDIWQRLLKRITFNQSKDGMGFNAQKVSETIQLNLFLPPERLVETYIPHIGTRVFCN
jgi:replication-associated recombination protein RarA